MDRRTEFPCGTGLGPGRCPKKILKIICETPLHSHLQPGQNEEDRIRHPFLVDNLLQIILEEVKDGEQDAGAGKRRQDGGKSEQVAVMRMRKISEVKVSRRFRRCGAIEKWRRRRRQNIRVQSLRGERKLKRNKRKTFVDSESALELKPSRA